MLITFEGIEGSGKSTQIELLNDYLKDKGYEVVKTREPGGTALGEALRKVLLQKDLHVLPLTELLVFMAVRVQHIEEVILPALQSGDIVLCDRFVDATFAYQGYGRGVDTGIIGTLNRLATKGITPNLTILLDCDVDRGLKRKQINNPDSDRFEEEEASFHQVIRAGYLKLAEEDAKRFFVVDGNQDIQAIHLTIRDRVRKLLENHGV
ncbi:MAG: Thymidylate kinase [Syntrophorhabdaceae bacterium PtaU1.Bin034]|nr:MAG: Thymidylate kinase [Syntrophorhabdaceae bacterium PtaU1.Bin034]